VNPLDGVPKDTKAATGTSGTVAKDGHMMGPVKGGGEIDSKVMKGLAGN
jgi:hypothetical protein